MLQKLARVFLLCELLLLLGCSRERVLKGDHPKELVGTWNLLIRSSCQDYDVRSDILTLHSDGTFEQEVTTKSGKQFHNTGQQWRYMSNSSSSDIALGRL